MFVIENYHAPIRQFADKIFSDRSLKSLLAAQYSFRAAASKNGVTNSEDLFAKAVLEKVGIGDGTDQSIREHHNTVRELARVDQMTGGAIQAGSDFRALDLVDLVSMLEQIVGQLEMPELKFETNVKDENFELHSRQKINQGKLVVDLILSGRMDASSTLSCLVSAHDTNGTVFDFSIAKMLGFGFWRFCSKNSKAMPCEIWRTLTEPLMLYRALVNELESKS